MAENGREDQAARQLDTDVDPEALAERFEALANPRRIQLLSFLTEPHYLEEIASHLGITRQAVRRHLDRLVEVGALERRSATRESGPVTEYVLSPGGLFPVHDAVSRLGSLRPRAGHDDPGDRTLPGDEPDPRSTPPQGPSLWVVRGLDAGASASLSPGGEQAWLIGRDPSCDLVLEADPYVSNRHAEVWRETDTFRVTDLASTNGTLHNGRELERGEDTVLDHGDVLEIGRTLVVVRTS